MFCSNCGQQLREGTRFCPRCGKEVNGESPGTPVSEQDEELTILDQGDDLLHNERPSYNQRSSTQLIQQERLGENATSSAPEKKNRGLIFVIAAVIIVAAICAILFGVIGGKTDLDRLEGKWLNEDGNGIVFYAPHDETSGDASIIEYDESQAASYEWHESSSRIILHRADSWGDQIEEVFEYEFEDDDTLLITPIQASDSTGTYSFDAQEAVVFYRE